MDDSNEVLIGADEGVVKTKGFKRMSEYARRWSKKTTLRIKWVQWEPTPGSETEDKFT